MKNRRIILLHLIYSIATLLTLHGSDAWAGLNKVKIPGMTLTGLASAAQAGVVSSGVSSTTDGMLSFGGGILQEFGKKRFFFQTGLLYHQKKYGVQDAYTYTSNWLQLPILVRTKIKFLNLGLGGYLDYRLGNVTYNSSIAIIPPLTTSLKSLDYGAIFSLGTTIFKSFYFDFRYSIGLANVSQGTPESMKFNEASLLFGLRMD